MPAAASAESGSKSVAPRPRAPSRVIIEGVAPEVDCGKFSIKRTVGEEVVVSADIFAEGHDVIQAVVLHRPKGSNRWTEAPMSPLVNDRWSGSFRVPSSPGRYEYSLEAWVDMFGSWRRDLVKKVEANQDVASELLEGALHVRQASKRATGEDASWLTHRADLLEQIISPAERIPAAARYRAARPDEPLARPFQETGL